MTGYVRTLAFESDNDIVDKSIIRFEKNMIGLFLYLPSFLKLVRDQFGLNALFFLRQWLRLFNWTNESVCSSHLALICRRSFKSMERKNQLRLRVEHQRKESQK